MSMSAASEQIMFNEMMRVRKRGKYCANDNMTAVSVVSDKHVDANDGNYDKYEKQIAELTAERDQLLRDLEVEHALAMQLQDDTDRLRTERDELKSKLNECKESLTETHAYCRYLQDKLIEYEKGQTDER